MLTSLMSAGYITAWVQLKTVTNLTSVIPVYFTHVISQTPAHLASQIYRFLDVVVVVVGVGILVVIRFSNT